MYPKKILYVSAKHAPMKSCRHVACASVSLSRFKSFCCISANSILTKIELSS